MRASAPLPSIRRLRPHDAQAQVSSGAAWFVDVRNAEAYAGGHLPGARCAPARAIVGRRHALRKDIALILY